MTNVFRRDNKPINDCFLSFMQDVKYPFLNITKQRLIYKCFIEKYLFSYKITVAVSILRGFINIFAEHYSN